MKQCHREDAEDIRGDLIVTEHEIATALMRFAMTLKKASMYFVARNGNS
jgi:hypothetical protein